MIHSVKNDPTLAALGGHSGLRVPPKPGANASRFGRHMDSYGGYMNGVSPIAGLFFNGKSENNMDDLGVPPF